MSSNISWVWIVIIGVCIGVYYLYKQGRMPWLDKFQGKSVKMPKMLTKMFEPSTETQIEKLKAQTEKERDKAKELKSVLEAKTELVKARAESIRLRKEIDGVSEKSVGREKQAEKKAQDVEKVKPRRL